MDNTFFDILGVLIAFLMVIALLSLLVTALVQMTQALFGIRGKNVHFALRCLLEEVGAAEGDEAADKAAKVLNASPAGLLAKAYDFKSKLSRLVGPAVSWINSDELPRALERANIGLSEKHREAVEEGFDDLMGALDKRLRKNLRAVAVVCSLVIAFVFQVSTPHLLSQLATDPARSGPIASATVSEGEAMDQLAALGIEPWRDPAFYLSNGDVQWSRLLGVLITAILLTFGAPFWFDTLKRVVGLRDALKKD